MSLRFSVLDRRAIRQLKAGQKLSEHGITVERLADNDVRYSVNVMIDGRRVHRVIGRERDGVTRTQAEEYIEQAKTDARAGRLNLPKGRKLPLTFTTAADLYLAKLVETEGKDFKSNEQHIRIHLKPYFGVMRLDQISTFTVQKFQAECRRKGIAEATINRILATYRRMGRRLAKWKVIAAPLPMVSLEKERNTREHVISDEEEEALLAAAVQNSHPGLWLFIKIGMATSLRHNEIVCARWENFDPERRRLRVRVKGGRWRRQPLTRGITEILIKEQAMAADPAGWLFPSYSTSGHTRKMSAAFLRCVIAAGLNPAVITPHTLRHTAITRLAQITSDIKTLMEFSGHETVTMVLRYVHAQDRAVDRALDRLEEDPPIKRTKDERSGLKRV